MATTKTRTRFFQSCLGVFQGGGCRGAAFAGAFQEAIERGVDFAGVAGTSAGSIVAALIGAGAAPDFLNKAVHALDFKKLLVGPEEVPSPPNIFARSALWPLRPFFKPVKIWRYQGLYSSKGIESWVNERLRELLPGIKARNIQFRDLPIPTYVVAADLVTNDSKIWSPATGDVDVAYAVRCSCSIPAFFQPVDETYIDGGVLSNLPAFVFAGPDFSIDRPFANRILAFSLAAERGHQKADNARSLLKATINTVVDGASKIQGRIVPGVHEIVINTGTIQATDFDKMNSSNIEFLINEGQRATREFFQDELGRVKGAQRTTNVLTGEDEIYAVITEALDDLSINHVVIRDDQTRWAYKLFPTLLAWRTRRVRLQVIFTSAAPSSDHERYRRRLLRALGAELYVSDVIPFRGFLLNPTDQALARALIIAPETPGKANEDVATEYRTPEDFPAIQSLWANINGAVTMKEESVDPPSIIRVSENEILDKLKRYVPPYNGSAVQLSMETISFDSMIALTRLVRGYKYKQIGQLFDLFKSHSLQQFESAAVRYTSEWSTLITPPVVEYTGDKYVLVQGNTRALYGFKMGLDGLRCVVARNLSTALPTNQRVALKNMLIGDRTLSVEDRYGSNLDKDYRNIEWATHHPTDTLPKVQI